MAVRDYRFFIFDDRYAVPTLNLVRAANAERARDLAQRILVAGSHHLAVEVWEDETLLFTLGEKASSRPAPQALRDGSPTSGR